jgi:hypothetical protein
MNIVKILRRLTAAALISGLHFSLCTGGLLSVASALANDVSRDYLQTADLMTPALPEIALCASMTPAEERPSVTFTPEEPSKGCPQGQACLLSASIEGRERSAPVIILSDDIAVSAAGLLPVSVREPAVRLDRPPPQPPSALLASVVKRE